MEAKTINEQLSNFNVEFRGDCHNNMDNRENRQRIFDKWIAIADKEEPAVRPYARLTVCSQIVKRALWGDNDEIAHYMSVAIDDIQYALNSDCDPCRDRFIPILHIQGVQHEKFFHVLAKEFTPEEVSKYLDAVVDTHLVETRFSYALHSLLYTIRGYIKVENYDQAIKLGDKTLALYRNHPADYACFKQDTTETIDLIKVEICNAHKYRGTATPKMLKRAKMLSDEHTHKRAAVAKSIAEQKAELMDLAERCRTAGNMQGYYGYMSALGDIGR